MCLVKWAEPSGAETRELVRKRGFSLGEPGQCNYNNGHRYIWRRACCRASALSEPRICYSGSVITWGAWASDESHQEDGLCKKPQRRFLRVLLDFAWLKLCGIYPSPSFWAPKIGGNECKNNEGLTQNDNPLLSRLVEGLNQSGLLYIWCCHTWRGWFWESYLHQQSEAVQ